MCRCVFVCMCVHMCGGDHLHLIITVITTISILNTGNNLGFLPFRNQESPFYHKFILNHFLWKYPSLLCNIFMCGLLFQIPPSEITSHVTLCQMKHSVSHFAPNKLSRSFYITTARTTVPACFSSWGLWKKTGFHHGENVIASEIFYIINTVSCLLQRTMRYPPPSLGPVC